MNTRNANQNILPYPIRKPSKNVHQQLFIVTASCELCDRRFSASSRWKSNPEILKHLTPMHQKLSNMEHRRETECEILDYSSQNELDVKRL